MLLNHKTDVALNPITVMVGNENVMAVKYAKLLGIQLDDNQKWKS